MLEMAKREKGWTKEVKKRQRRSDGLMGEEESEFGFSERERERESMLL